MAPQIIRARMNVLADGVRKISLSYLENKNETLPYSIYKTKFQVCKNYKTY